MDGVTPDWSNNAFLAHWQQFKEIVDTYWFQGLGAKKKLYEEVWQHICDRKS